MKTTINRVTIKEIKSKTADKRFKSIVFNYLHITIIYNI